MENNIAEEELLRLEQKPMDCEELEEVPDDDDGDVVDEFKKLILKDSRMCHFIADLIAGTDVDEAVSSNFKGANVAIDEERIKNAVAEAEQRGYVKGRNEKIELIKRELNQTQNDVTDAPRAERYRSILEKPRRSVWD